MGSGEGDAIRDDVTSVAVNNSNTTGITGITTWGYWPKYTGISTSSYSYSYPVYKYQIKCPAKTCKKMNWLELDKITPCTKCGVKLKAVSEQADFEVAVDK